MEEIVYLRTHIHSLFKKRIAKNEDNANHILRQTMPLSILTNDMDKQVKKVLIVEKDTGVANMIRAVLGIINIPAVHVQLAQDAIFEMGQHELGMIIANSKIPDMDGYELMSYARGNQRTERTPFLMLVAENENRHINLPPEKAADKYISTPFTAKDLLDAVKQFLVQPLANH